MQKTAITLGLCLAFGIPAQAETGSPQSGLSRLCLESEKACAYYYGDGKLAFIENESFDAGEKFDRIDLSKGNALIPAQNDRKKYGYINTKDNGLSSRNLTGLPILLMGWRLLKKKDP